MKLKAFSEDVRENWIRSRCHTVRITGSAHLSNNTVPDLLFVLVEPVATRLDKIVDGDMLASITSDVVTSIIRRSAGLYIVTFQKRSSKRRALAIKHLTRYALKPSLSTKV